MNEHNDTCLNQRGLGDLGALSISYLGASFLSSLLNICYYNSFSNTIILNSTFIMV